MYSNYNYIDVLNIKTKSFISFCIIYAFVLFITSLALFLKTYTTYKFDAIYNDEFITIKTYYQNSDKIVNSDFIEINNEYYYIDHIKYGEISLINEEVVMQDLYVYISSEFESNEVTNVTFYSDYERIIEKIIKVIL